MRNVKPRTPGRHFLQIPGPTPVPDRVLRAMDMPVLDHRGPEFQALARRVLEGLKGIFKTKSSVFLFPASGTGAWEAALVNTLSPGYKVLMFETGHFATLWKNMALKLSLRPEFIASDWRTGADAGAIETRLREDTAHDIKAVCVVHNETSTGATSRIDEVRRAIDAARHPALLLVDTISSLGSIDYRHDEWGGDGHNCGWPEGPRGRCDVDFSKTLLVVGRNGRPQCARLLPLYAGDDPALRARCRHRDAQ